MMPSSMPKKWVLASHNLAKAKEFSALLAPLAIELIAQSRLGVIACAEPYDTFLENALAKARHAALCTQLPALADDSGLCVAALNGQPGVHSARFAGEPSSDARNNQRLVECLRDVAERRVHYVCVLVWLRHAKDPQPLVAEGVWAGQWCDEPLGEGGFGYDPHVWLPDYACTVAQLSTTEKNRLSHRGQAWARLLTKLQATDQ